MRTLLLAITLGALLASIPATAVAQERSWGISVSVGPSFPAGDFVDAGDTGFHVLGAFGLDMGLPFDLRGDVSWQAIRAEDDDKDFYTQIVAGLNAVFLGRFPLLQPYGLVGAGYTRTDPPEHEGHSHGDTRNTVGLNVGVGARFPFLGVRGFVEVRYLNVVGSGDATDFQTVPLSVGIYF